MVDRLCFEDICDLLYRGLKIQTPIESVRFEECDKRLYHHELSHRFLLDEGWPAGSADLKVANDSVETCDEHKLVFADAQEAALHFAEFHSKSYV